MPTAHRHASGLYSGRVDWEATPLAVRQTGWTYQIASVLHLVWADAGVPQERACLPRPLSRVADGRHLHHLLCILPLGPFPRCSIGCVGSARHGCQRVHVRVSGFSPCAGGQLHAASPSHTPARQPSPHLENPLGDRPLHGTATRGNVRSTSVHQIKLSTRAAAPMRTAKAPATQAIIPHAPTTTGHRSWQSVAVSQPSVPCPAHPIVKHELRGGREQRGVGRCPTGQRASERRRGGGGGEHGGRHALRHAARGCAGHASPGGACNVVQRAQHLSVENGMLALLPHSQGFRPSQHTEGAWEEVVPVSLIAKVL